MKRRRIYVEDRLRGVRVKRARGLFRSASSATVTSAHTSARRPSGGLKRRSENSSWLPLGTAPSPCFASVPLGGAALHARLRPLPLDRGFERPSPRRKLRARVHRGRAGQLPGKLPRRGGRRRLRRGRLPARAGAPPARERAAFRGWAAASATPGAPARRERRRPSRQRPTASSSGETAPFGSRKRGVGNRARAGSRAARSVRAR